jgi:hypothetical protein
MKRMIGLVLVTLILSGCAIAINAPASIHVFNHDLCDSQNHGSKMETGKIKKGDTK